MKTITAKPRLCGRARFLQSLHSALTLNRASCWRSVRVILDANGGGTPFCKDWAQCHWPLHLSELPFVLHFTLCVSPVQSELFYYFHPLASGFWMNYTWCVIYNDVSVRELLLSLNSTFPPPSWRFKAKRCFGCIGAKEKGTWSTLPCKDTSVANVTFNTKWQLNARFGFLTAIKCLDYELIFERFHGIKYNKLSEGKEQEMRGEKRSCWNIFRHDISLCR